MTAPREYCVAVRTVRGMRYYYVLACSHAEAEQSVSALGTVLGALRVTQPTWNEAVHLMKAFLSVSHQTSETQP
jgi:hypothetical protein